MIGNKDMATCPLMHSLSVLSGKWKPSIIWYLSVLFNGSCRYGELKRSFPYNVSHKVFTDQLRELAADGILEREEFDEMPPRVEYTLTAKGRSLAQILYLLRDWGVLYGDYDPEVLVKSRGIYCENEVCYPYNRESNDPLETAWFLVKAEWSDPEVVDRIRQYKAKEIDETVMSAPAEGSYYEDPGC